MNTHAVNVLLTETLGDVDGMQAGAEVEAGAEVQAIREVEVRMGSSAVRISGATLSIKITALVIFVQITCIYIERERIILLNQVAEWEKNSINCQNV